MGDMNWQNHCGIFTAPIQIAVRFKIPLIIWEKYHGIFLACLIQMILLSLVQE